jgi:predicted XRE-type DNA-binding protein
MKGKKFTTGSGNIFVDLGFSEQESIKLSIKACLFRKLQEILSESKLTQAELAKRLGIKQPHVSEIINGKMSGFSTERIANYLMKLNYDICLGTQPSTSGKQGRIRPVAQPKDAA